MKKVFLNKMKKILVVQQQEILQKLKQDINADIDTDGDETDEIQAKILARTNAQLLIREKEKLLKVESALKRIDNGTFGDCEECGDKISEKRLMINPGFITCIICAEDLETKSKRGQF
jgi:DnaK suppressor protein